MKSIAELRSSEHVGRPERTYPICVAGRLVAERDRLIEELVKAQDDEREKPRPMGGRSTAKKLAEQAEAVRQQMIDHTVDILLRAIDNGDWRRWCRKHPAREDEPRDKMFGVPICNSDDLIANLRAPVEVNKDDTDLLPCIAKIGDAEPDKGDWEFIASNAAYGDLLRVAQLVMSMHETAVDLGKSPVAWLRAQTSEADSE